MCTGVLKQKTFADKITLTTLTSLLFLTIFTCHKAQQICVLCVFKINGHLKWVSISLVFQGYVANAKQKLKKQILPISPASWDTENSTCEFR